jgi:shikimate 5-dehydrogenase/shikimate kinase
MQAESHLTLHSPEDRSFMSVRAARKRKADSLDELERGSPLNSAVSIDKDRRVELLREDASGLLGSHAPFQQPIRTFDRDASIVFVGPRGNGKSSLAVIAATALQREAVDADDYFFQATGMTQAAFRKAHGLEDYRLRQAELLRKLLSRHEKNCVIACGPHVVVEKGRELLEDYSRCHAVICVGREADMIERCLDLKDQGRLTDVIQEMHPIYHQVSNFEYYNLDERWRNVATSRSEHELQDILPNREFRRKSFQTLQNTKTDLTRFLNVAFGLTSSEGLFHTLHPPDPEMRPNTVALSIPMDLVESPNVDLNQFEGGKDAVELVMEVTLSSLRAPMATMTCDTIGRSVAVIRRHLALPVICHFRLDSVDDSQLTPDILRSYFCLLHLGLRFAPEYLTVDLRGPDDDIRTLVDSRGRTKIMGNLYNRNVQHGLWTGPKPDQIYQRARGLGCNVVRLYQLALSTADNFSCLAFMSRTNSLSNGVPVIAYNMGTLGNLSSAFNTSLTPVTHPLLQASKSPAGRNAISPAAPTITTREIQQLQYATQTLNALKFYVFGSDVKYSLSPAMHSAAFGACWMPHTYDTRQCDNLTDVRALIQDPEFGGASISMPFKPEIVLLVESLSSSAKEIGAVNTLIPVRHLDRQQLPEDPYSKSQRNRAGPITAFHGANTDWMGIYACISRYISPANAPSHRTTSVVIGAGGIARAAIYAMARLGVSNIFILNRTLENAETLAKHYNSKVQGSHDFCESTATSSTSKAVNPVVHILKSRDDVWPEEYSYPSIVVYTIPTRQAETSGHRDFRVPTHWLQNLTGGLLVDV